MRIDSWEFELCNEVKMGQAIALNSFRLRNDLK